MCNKAAYSTQLLKCRLWHVLGVAASLLVSLTDEQSIASDKLGLARANDARMRNAKDVAGAVYFLVFISMLGLMGCTALTFAWFWAWPYKQSSLAGCWNVFFWFNIFLVWFMIAAWAIGFVGWGATGVVYSIVILMIMIVYWYHARKRMNEIHALIQMGVELPEASWAGVNDETLPSDPSAGGGSPSPAGARIGGKQIQYTPYAVEHMRGVGQAGSQPTVASS